MERKRQFKNLLGIGLGILFMAGCGTADVKKAEIAPTANPAEELERIEEKMQEAHAQQVDVLAPEDLRKSQKWLKEAREDMAEGDDHDEVIESLATAEGFLDRAMALASERESTVQGILDARMAALEAGVRNNGDLSERFKELDDEVRDEAGNFREGISSEEFSELQSDYLKLETEAVQHKYLADARQRIKMAKDYDAEDHAKVTLDSAKKSLKNAENRIATSPREPANFQESVVQANTDARLLTDVIQTVRNRDYEISESVALQLVQQNREIQEREQRIEAQNQMLEFQDAQLTVQDRTISSQDQALGAQNEALRQASQTISMQQAIDQVRNEFGEDEAEVYQQGDKLIIRLKKINFPSGQANLPPNAMPLLQKIGEVTRNLDASRIEIQGHTDSTGSKKINEKLSKERAQTVAEYFKSTGIEAEIESEGFGPSKPLASNESAEGRALNRRVDVVISTQDSSRSPASVDDERSNRQDDRSRQNNLQNQRRDSEERDSSRPSSNSNY